MLSTPARASVPGPPAEEFHIGFGLLFKALELRTRTNYLRREPQFVKGGYSQVYSLVGGQP